MGRTEPGAGTRLWSPGPELSVSSSLGAREPSGQRARTPGRRCVQTPLAPQGFDVTAEMLPAARTFALTLAPPPVPWLVLGRAPGNRCPEATLGPSSPPPFRPVCRLSSLSTLLLTAVSAHDACSCPARHPEAGAPTSPCRHTGGPSPAVLRTPALGDGLGPRGELAFLSSLGSRPPAPPAPLRADSPLRGPVLGLGYMVGGRPCVSSPHPGTGRAAHPGGWGPRRSARGYLVTGAQTLASPPGRWAERVNENVEFPHGPGLIPHCLPLPEHRSPPRSPVGGSPLGSTHQPRRVRSRSSVPLSLDVTPLRHRGRCALRVFPQGGAGAVGRGAFLPGMCSNTHSKFLTLGAEAVSIRVVPLGLPPGNGTVSYYGR